MTVLSVKSFKQAFEKAKKLSCVEEPLMICGVNLVLSNLRPDQYSLIDSELGVMSDDDFTFKRVFHELHLAHSIVELNGVDLRNTRYIETDSVDDKTKKPVKVELVSFLRKEILASWSQEAIDVAFAKFTEVVVKAEKVAREGVVFSIKDEDPDDKIRQHLDDVLELSKDMPEELFERVLQEKGFTIRTTRSDLNQVDDVLSDISKESEPNESLAEDLGQFVEPHTDAVQQPLEEVQSKMEVRQPLTSKVVIPNPSVEPQQSFKVDTKPTLSPPQYSLGTPKASSQGVVGERPSSGPIAHETLLGDLEEELQVFEARRKSLGELPNQPVIRAHDLTALQNQTRSKVPLELESYITEGVVPTPLNPRWNPRKT